jgi:signal transduction histidine kinase
MAWLVIIGLLPLVVLGLLGYGKASNSRRQDIRNNISATAEVRKASVQDFFARAGRELEQQSRLSANLTLLGVLHNDLLGSGLDARTWTRSAHWRELANTHGHELLRFRNTSPWRDILLLDAAGTVLFSCRQDDDLGSNLLTGLYSRSNLAAAVREAKDSRSMVLSQFAAYEPSGAEPGAFLVVPLNGDEGQILGLMAFLIGAAELGEIAGQRNLLVGNMSVYLVDEDLRVLTRPGPGSGLAVLQDRALTEVTGAWLERSRSLLANESVSPAAVSANGEPLSYQGPEGNRVFGKCTTVHALGRDFGMVTEIDQATALAGLGALRLAMGLMIGLTVLLVLAAGQVILHRVVQPVVALAEIMRRVADGHEVENMHVAGHNEVGDLADQFAIMINRLNEADRSRDQQYRLQESQFELNKHMRGEPDSTTLAAAILEHIGDYYGAQVGAFYLSRPGQRLALAAQLGDDDEDWPVRELREGQGVVGRAASRRRIQLLRDLPPNHMRICTATGSSLPRTLIVAPFHLAGQIKGVMELGVTGDLADDDLAFLRLSAESVAVALDSARSRERVNRLLDETRRQAGALARQQKELQETNEQLAHADRCKSEFLANMSHELRTPLNSMMLMSQVLGENRHGGLNGDEVEAAQTINGAGKDLLTIIDDILDLSKVDAGRLELVPDRMNLASLVAELRALFLPVADGKNLQFRTEIGADVPAAIFTDGLRLKQVLKNLLNNACKFTETGSVELRVHLASAGRPAAAAGASDWVALSVTDTGIGMDEEIQSRIFEPFRQADGTVGRRYGGTGLGLSISRRLTELLQGRLDVESAPGAGSRFTITLPRQADFESSSPALLRSQEPGRVPDRQPAPQVAALPAADPAPAEAGLPCDLRLVLVDDDMRTIYRIGGVLARSGASPYVIRSRSGLLAEADTLAAGSVLAVNPWCGTEAEGAACGEELVRKLRGLLAPGVRLVVLVPPGRSCDPACADAVLSKPLDAEHLLAACRGLLCREEVFP